MHFFSHSLLRNPLLKHLKYSLWETYGAFLYACAHVVTLKKKHQRLRACHVHLHTWWYAQKRIECKCTASYYRDMHISRPLVHGILLLTFFLCMRTCCHTKKKNINDCAHVMHTCTHDDMLKKGLNASVLHHTIATCTLVDRLCTRFYFLHACAHVATLHAHMLSHHKT